MLAFVLAFERTRIPPDNEARYPDQIVDSLKNQADITDSKKLTEALLSYLKIPPPNEDEKSKNDRIELFSQVARRIDDHTKKIYNAVGRGRFAFTLLMAAVYEKLSPMGVSVSFVDH